MKVLLVRPPSPFQGSPLLSHTRPLNLACLASWLRQHDIEVAIADYEVERYEPEEFRRSLLDGRPDVVGVSCMTPTIRSGAALCAIAKSALPSVVTVVGGAHASALPVETLREFPSFDLAVFGEGEETLLELCRSIASGNDRGSIAGLAFRGGNGPRRNPPRPLLDLDRLPLPDRELMPVTTQAGHSSRGFANTLRSTELYTSRGCPFGCSFCAIQGTFGRTVRFRSLSAIAEEIGQVTERHRINHLVIADDTFTLDQERAAEITTMLGKSGIDSWNCDTRVSNVTPALLRHMKRCGCEKVAFGVESGSPRSLERIGKGITVEQVRRAVAWAREAGIRHIEGNFIIAADPRETADDVELTRRLITELPWTFVSVAIVVPYPGTPVYDYMKGHGYLEEGISWDDFVMFGSSPRWRTEHFTAPELLELQKRLTREFYLNPRYIARQLSAVRSWRDMRYWAAAGTGYLRWYVTGRA